MARIPFEQRRGEADGRVDLVPVMNVFLKRIEQVERVVIREVDLHHVAVNELDVGNPQINCRPPGGRDEVASLLHSGELAISLRCAHQTELANPGADIQNAQARCSYQHFRSLGGDSYWRPMERREFSDLSRIDQVKLLVFNRERYRI